MNPSPPWPSLPLLPPPSLVGKFAPVMCYDFYDGPRLSKGGENLKLGFCTQAQFQGWRKWPSTLDSPRQQRGTRNFYAPKGQQPHTFSSLTSECVPLPVNLAKYTNFRIAGLCSQSGACGQAGGSRGAGQALPVGLQCLGPGRDREGWVAGGARAGFCRQVAHPWSLRPQGKGDVGDLAAVIGPHRTSSEGLRAAWSQMASRPLVCELDLCFPEPLFSSSVKWG